ncbi:D-alanyl-D-alanine carboxypeptidase/D-alanyl-D-alanine-endopeptidase [Streptomyces sp. NPDC048664]|uniref:D-alanyl-D-alanine carboxypeptidase/D-alanyl-D-alanine endopeptidase n=1 Tax=Streptomyces sp. NPDC048664 TaxID=3154505 RepID=UPI003423197B
MPEPRAWRAAGPRLARLARAVEPRLKHLARSVRPGARRDTETAAPRVARLGGVVKPHVARVARAVRPRSGGLTTPQLAAVATVAGLALAAGAVTAAGPWDSAGQRTAERERAAAWGGEGGADHAGDSGTAARTPVAAPSAVPVLAGIGDGAANTAKSAPLGPELSTVLGRFLSDGALGPRRSAAVVDVATGRRLYGRDVSGALTPASTTKIATAVAALSAAGADHRFTTRTALEPGTGKLVLVGGGDPTLTARAKADGWASLRTLADRTAAALKKRHTASVTLSYDASLFTGPALHPIGANENLAPVTALAVDEGRRDGSSSGPAERGTDPAGDAARAFGTLLRARGVTTTGGTAAAAVPAAKASARAATLASVQSPPLSEVVERMLTNSDNDIAEALARQTALALGGQPSFDGGAAAIRAQLDKLGLPLAGAAFHDGSGLNRDDRLTADLLTRLLATAGSRAHPELRPVLTGLPVAGFTGTLSDRYADAADYAGVGLVRAKTGTLTGVNTLAGTVVDADGRLLAFAFLTDGSPDQQGARAALDRTAAALAGCGCR